MRAKIITIISFLLVFELVNCQFRNPRFRQLNINNHLPGNRIQCIEQDTDGMIWIGTSQGLCKYNGYNIYTYRADNDNNKTLSSDYISSIYVDITGNLWIGTDKGVNLYNAENDNFRQILFSGDGNDYSAASSILCISQSPDSAVWVGTESGVFIIHKDLATVTRLKQDFPETSGIINPMVFGILFSNDNAYISSLNAPLVKIDLNTKKASALLTDGRKHPLSGWLTRMTCDASGRIWVYNSHCVRILYPGDNNLVCLKSDLVGYKSVHAVEQDNRGNIWLGTEGGGVTVLDSSLALLKRFKHSNEDPQSLCSDIVYDIYADNQGNVFIGTYDAGVSIYERWADKFYNETPIKSNLFKLKKQSVLAIHEDTDNNIWVGTDGGGLSYYNYVTGESKAYLFSENCDNCISDNVVKSLAEDSEGNIYAGTFRGGINIIHRKTGEIARLEGIELPEVQAWTMFFDGETKYFGLLRFGLVIQQPDGTFKYLYGNSNYGRLSEISNVIHISKANDGRIILGTEQKGMYFYNPTTDELQQVSMQINGRQGIISTTVYGVYQDEKGIYWVAGNRGITRYNPDSASFINYTTKQGLSHNSCRIIKGDSTGNIWIGTSLGISKFIPEKGLFKNFDVNDGLQSGEFNYNAICIASNGYYYFGGTKGLSYFRPDEIKNNPYKPPVIISGLKIFNTPVTQETEIDGRKILSKHISKTKKIKLNHDDMVFELEFAALNYSLPNECSYKYRLEGFETNWNYAQSNKRFASYTNLNPGTYQFQVFASNNDEVWNETPAEMTIVVSTPFWQTWYFIGGVVLLLIMLVVLGYKLRLRNLELQKKKLEHIVKIKTKDIKDVNKLLQKRQKEITLQNEELSMHRHKLEELIQQRTVELEKAKHQAEESDRLKTSFLANMSHEIRTPMNAIVGFVGLLDDDFYTPQERKRFIGSIRNSADVLMNLINDIIDISKIESGELSVTYTDCNIGKIMEELYHIYKIRNENIEVSSVKLVLKNELEDNLTIHSDENRIKQILTNLLDNAFKFTDMGTIEMGACISENNIVMFVSDTGKGIPKQHQEKIFDRFTKIEDDITKLYRGAGLGLYITKQLVMRLGGSLQLQSEVNKGSVFTISIPLNKESGIGNIEHTTPNYKHYNWEGKTLLIAEDEISNITYLKYLLRKTRINIIHAADGVEAVEKVLSRQYAFDAILMDIKMPNMDGYEATSRIKIQIPNLPIIAVTAYAMSSDREDAFKHQCDDYISKPINPTDLLEILHKHIMHIA